MRDLEWSSPQRWKVGGEVTYQGLGEGWERLCNLRLQFCKMTRVWRWVVVVTAQQCECN